MSASSKKKLRKEQEAVKMTEQQLSAQKEAKKLNLYTTIFVVTLAVLLVVAVTVGIGQTIANSGTREKNTTALTIGSHEISNAELNYFYMDAINNFYGQYGQFAALLGLDASKPLDQQIRDEETGETWADDFLNTAKENAKAVYAMADAAEAAGFALSEDELAAIDAGVDNLALYAKMYGYGNAKDYVKAIYGKGADIESLKEYTRVTSLANAFYADYAKNLSYEDADLRAKESENFNAYSSYTFNSYYLSATSFLSGGTTDDEGKTTYSDEEKAASVAAAEAAAQALTSKEVASAADFEAAIDGLTINEGKDSSATENKALLYTNLNSTYSDWLTDAGRKEGDKAYFASTSTDAEGNETVNGYYVVYYIGSTDNTFALANVRHILLGFEGGTKDETTGMTVYSDEEKAAAKTAAEEALAEWKAGEMTEESFAELANAKSTDGDGTTGGLYENVYPGQMVTNFNDWCFDASRKSGDTGIVESEYGYHVMFYSGDSEQNYRDFMIENELRKADAEEWYASVIEAATATEGNVKYIRTDLVLGGAR